MHQEMRGYMSVHTRGHTHTQIINKIKIKNNPVNLSVLLKVVYSKVKIIFYCLTDFKRHI